MGLISRVSSRTYRYLAMIRFARLKISNRKIQNSAILFGKHFSKEQEDEIEKVFQENIYPDVAKRQELADKFDKPLLKITQKFIRKRQKYSNMYGQKLQLDNKNNIGDENYKILRAVFEQEQSPNLET